ncbi:MAG: hypothetical protein M0Q02_03000 [Candidatus Muirbacterium halophilum]|nr:hypothetical protein [Candidatus Muirbacterium halophilum]
MKNNMLGWSFINDFLREYELLTPYGKSWKKNQEIIKDLKELQYHYKLNDILLDFLNNSNEENIALLSYCISRIPYIDSFKIVNSADVFLFKRFFFNFKKIIKLLGNKISTCFDIKWEFEEIYEILTKGGGDIESFHLSTSYSNNLLEIRKNLAVIDENLKEKRKDFFEKILKQYNLDFTYRDFIIISYSKADEIKQCDFFYIETYDSENFIVKPVFPIDIFELLKEKEKLIKIESDEENIIIEDISKKIFKISNIIKKNINSIKLLDIVFSRVILMKKYNMYQKPEFKKEKTLIIEKGEFIPLREKCKKKKLQYYPLDIELKKSIGLIRGSNMGGKTIVIKSIAFFQILAQYGFFLPCQKFISTIYDDILTISEIVEVELSGLSSFGTEITNLINVLNKKGNILLLIDEFGRTTNSDEAFAMLCGLIEFFIKNSRFTALFSTHFLKIPDFSEVFCFRMKGLDNERFDKEYKYKKNTTIKARIELINNFMEYIIEKDNNNRQSQDALNVAEILGLDENIIKHARNYMGRQNEKQIGTIS